MATPASLTQHTTGTVSDELIERAHRTQMLRAELDSRHAAIVVAAGYSLALEHVVRSPVGARDIARRGRW
jgi:hypothetical protein